MSKAATEHDESVFVRLLDEGKTVDDRSDEGTADKEANEDRDASIACCLSIVLQWHVPLALWMMVRPNNCEQKSQRHR